ncbi:MAG TPA: tyrosine--tRNA ligase [Nocardioidaceae bacterium]|nr:tyrosine--tRNA ligase [Nocardioidaceae bacterium]
MDTHVLDELTRRGLLAQTTDIDALRAQLDSGATTYYVGFDPTAPSLHMGNLVQLVTARRLQQAGHSPLILVGGATGLIGDPKDSGERTLNSKDVVGGWVDRVRGQVERYIDLDGPNAGRVVNNLDWTGPLSTIDFLRDIGKHFPVNRMLGREVVRTRLESGISYTEFSYVLLQAMDYLELFRRYNCRIQTGGSDQWGNITAGVELIRRATGEQVHALATPLITKADGSKYGKTESGTVWLSPELTSPYAFYQFWLNSEDAKVGEYLRIFSDRDTAEIDELVTESKKAPAARIAQRALATDVTTLVHGAEETQAAEHAARALFGRAELAELPEPVLEAALAEAPHATLKAGEELPSVVDALVATGLADSRSAARRTVGEGGAYVNNVRVTEPDGPLPDSALLYGRWLVVRKGKRSVAGAEVVRA